MYKTGDIVEIKSWDEMLRDGHFQGTADLDNFEFGDIYFPQDGIGFPEYAQYLCGTQFVVQNDNKTFLKEIDGITITEAMVKLIQTID